MPVKGPASQINPNKNGEAPRFSVTGPDKIILICHANCKPKNPRAKLKNFAVEKRLILSPLLFPDLGFVHVFVRLVEQRPQGAMLVIRGDRPAVRNADFPVLTVVIEAVELLIQLAQNALDLRLGGFVDDGRKLVAAVTSYKVLRRHSVAQQPRTSPA